MTDTLKEDIMLTARRLLSAITDGGEAILQMEKLFHAASNGYKTDQAARRLLECYRNDIHLLHLNANIVEMVLDSGRGDPERLDVMASVKLGDISRWGNAQTYISTVAPVEPVSRAKTMRQLLEHFGKLADEYKPLLPAGAQDELEAHYKALGEAMGAIGLNLSKAAALDRQTQKGKSRAVG